MSNSPTNVQGYFKRYTDLVQEQDLQAAFKAQSAVIDQLLPAISEERSTFSYAPGKWTIKELVQHVIDAERIFSYRALCFARKESSPLPSFDENSYAENSRANNRSWQQLAEEFLTVRSSTLLLYSSFDDEMMTSAGTAGTNILTPAQLGFITIGHFTHHHNILSERYLIR